MVDRDANALLLGLGEDFVRLLQRRADRFLDLDVNAMLQDAQAQLVVELRAGGNGDDVRLHRADHLVQIREPGSHA